MYCIQRERQTIERETDCNVCIKKMPNERDQIECIEYRERQILMCVLKRYLVREIKSSLLYV